MFWKIVFVIYLAVVILDFTFTLTTTITAKKKFKTIYPDFKPNKPARAELFETTLKMVLINTLPIFNFFMLITYLFNSEKIVNTAIEKAKGE